MAQPNYTHGGSFYFDEPYCGVRTAWVPKMKPVSICETGFASIGGTAVEPNVVPGAVFGSHALTPPAWLDQLTKEKFLEWMALGWKPSDITGPYGSNFAFDEIGQALALMASVGWLKSLDFIARICVYAVDARPSAGMFAQYQGNNLFYIDAPLYKLSQTINGKLVGGVLNPDDLP